MTDIPGFEFIPYQSAYRSDFARLNIDWLEEFFVVEPIDELVLHNPEDYILNKGGDIFFALKDGQAVGTVAMKATDRTGVFELTKLGVDKSCQGAGVGEALCQMVFDRFIEVGGALLFLETNTKLQPAIRLYKRLDFVEKPLPSDTPYERANYYMEWQGAGLTIHSATSRRDIAIVRDFFQEYAHWLEAETGLSLAFQGFEEEMAGFPSKYETLLLAKYNSRPVGAVALLKHDDAVCEMKRLFVTPSGWGKSVGKHLSVAVMEEARQRGFTVMLLDSLRRLENAVALYRALGFEETDPYNENPEADVVYMKRDL
ncbi:hypothetical protein GCM10017044_08570 [Kordiimonas sediminis]|uniref:N-acetyltransferase domain-containing protein n=1 Tax=Kordiimonas sediminis TaxID=1735581 RepID=A0A919ANK5_9PROT|nr:GNAT family N-acetyltransferase [Kordiimonas sediminis]GHF16553.1 hypothetical protein GCM10017044_08570 [Kordiimonas sediminis]